MQSGWHSKRLEMEWVAIEEGGYGWETAELTCFLFCDSFANYDAGTKAFNELCIYVGLNGGINI